MAEPTDSEELRFQRLATARAVFAAIKAARELGATAEQAIAAAEQVFGTAEPEPAIERCGGPIYWEQAFGLLVTRPRHHHAGDRRAYYHGRCSVCGEHTRQVTAPAIGQQCRREKP